MPSDVLTSLESVQARGDRLVEIIRQMQNVAVAFSGGIDNQLSADEPHRTSQYAPGRELEFTLGSGDGEVRIESFSGEVVLRPQ